jgi:hypothetical protein
VAVNFDIVSSLDDINAIKHVEESLVFDGHGELVVQQVE